jgi:L-ascorbate metabolism protein UlaG (beta-lactamase superfamily)
MVLPVAATAFHDTWRVIHVGQPRVTFLGHATIVIDMDGVRILTDPILRSRVGPLVRLRAPIEEARSADWSRSHTPTASSRLRPAAPARHGHAHGHPHGMAADFAGTASGE